MAKRENMATKTREELQKLLTDARTALRAERFAATGTRAKNPSIATKLKRDIARILTVQGSHTS